jgi:NhaC family Na+:H+ antiporter
MGSDIAINTDNEMIDNLLSTRGMAGMLNTIWLIICAMIFGGAMEATGLLSRVAESIIKYAESTGSLIATTVGTCIFFNITASDQYLSIVVPGRMFADTYKEKGLAPENLSRTLEDSGTVTSVLVPWNTCGATQSAVLGVATFAYLPFCFFNIISPLMTIAYGYLGIKIKKLKQ